MDTDIQDMAIIRDNAIRSVDQRFYSVAELDAWAEPLDMRLQKIAQLSAADRPDVQIVAIDAHAAENEILGFGQLKTQHNLLASCYVKACAKGRGVGRALVAEMERQAIEKGLTFLQLEGAKNAKSFYQNLGFRTVSCGEHSIPNPRMGQCLMMRKDF